MRVNARRGNYELQQWSKLRQTAPDGLPSKQQPQQRPALTRHSSEKHISSPKAASKLLARRQNSPGGPQSPTQRSMSRDAMRNASPYSPVASSDSFDHRGPLDAHFNKGRATPEPQRNDPTAMHNYRSNSNAAQQHAAQMSALQQHIMNLEERLQAAEFEKEQLLVEKSHWITTLQDENNVLVSVLHDTRKAKELFLQELDLLHRERLRVKHFNSESLNHVQEFIASMPIAMADSHSIPIHVRSKAKDLHNELCNLVLQVKANQEQVMEFVSRQATFAEHALLTGNLDACHGYLNDVRDLASARPNNITAAKEILEHLPEAVLSAALNLQAASSPSRGSGQGYPHSGHSPENAAKSEAFLELEEEVSRLTTQNTILVQSVEELESTVEHLRRDLRNANAGATLLDSSQINGVSAFDELPDDVRSIAWRVLSSFATDEINAHPLASSLPPEMVSEASKEIALQLRGLMAKLLIPAITANEGRIDMNVEISNALEAPMFQGELLSMVTLFMAYMFKTQVVALKDEYSTPSGSRRPSYSRRPSRSALPRDSSAGSTANRRPFS